MSHSHHKDTHAQDAHDEPIYLDNAATSWPKPAQVLEAVALAERLGGSPGRSAHARAMEADRTLLAARRATASFLGAPDAREIAFLPSCTYAANTMIYSLPSNARVLVSPFEHNAVTRPLARARARGVIVDHMRASENGVLDLPGAARQIQAASRSIEGPYTHVICQQANNVTGAIQPIAELADLAHEAGAKLIVDGAQAAGHLLINLDDLGCDAWFASGHKGILGPRGVGILYVKKDCPARPLCIGGTGFGDEDGIGIEDKRPDCFESGTINLPAIVGMTTGMAFIAQEKRELLAHDIRLCTLLMSGLQQIPGIRVLGPDKSARRVPIISFMSDRLAPDTLAYQLDNVFGIEVRAGIHCSPATHDLIGTRQTGAVRISPSYATTVEEVEIALDAIAALVKRAE